MAATLETSGPHSTTLLAPYYVGRSPQLLVFALRDATVAIGKQLARETVGAKWRLSVAHTLASALRHMSEINFDLILVDLSLDAVRAHLGELVAAAGITLVYGLHDDENGELALSARRDGIADVLSIRHLQGPSTARLVRLMLESARAASNTRLLAAAVEGAPVAYAMADALQPDMPLMYVNEQFVTLTGYQPNEVIGRNPRFLQGPLTDSRDVDRIRDAIRKTEPLYIELVNYRKDGQAFWNGMLLRPIRAANGAVTHFVATLRDMSERRQTEESLERSARLHRLLIATSGGMTLFADPNGALRAPLMEFELFTGLRFDEYRSGNWATVVHPDDRTTFNQARASLASSKESNCTFRLWHAPSGSWRYVEQRLLPLFDGHGLLSEWIGTLTDVHDRQADEQERRQSREFLTQALDALSQYMLYVDRQGAIRWLNRACAEWLGVTKNELLGRLLIDIAEATDRELLPRRMQLALAGQSQHFHEHVCFRHRTATLDVTYLPHRQKPSDAQCAGFFWIGQEPRQSR